MVENNYLIFGGQSVKPVKLARIWLYNAIFALAVAGLFALPPVLLRNSFKNIPDAQRIFDTALIVHVNMSVLIWLISICCMVFALKTREKFLFFSRGGALLSCFGTLLIAISPFIAKSMPSTNNYIPVLGNIWFLLGLACFGCGVLLQAVICLLTFRFFRKIDEDFGRSFAACSTAFIIIIAALCFILSSRQLRPQDFDYATAKSYYEILFWAGGHILQFGYVQMMVFAWFWVAESLAGKTPNRPWQVIFIYSFGVVLAISAPFIYLEYGIQSFEFIDFFTRQMQYGLGIAPLMAGILLLSSRRWPLKFEARSNALILSLILFAAGGIIGFIIRGSNAIIPAHYHGSIVAVTLAFMALVYDILPRLKFKSTGRFAAWQPVIYGVGQLMHISGLAIMGGYGALRKTAGSAEVHTIFGKILFAIGGGFAILGGFLFVVIILQAMWPKAK